MRSGFLVLIVFSSKPSNLMIQWVIILPVDDANHKETTQLLPDENGAWDIVEQEYADNTFIGSHTGAARWFNKDW